MWDAHGQHGWYGSVEWHGWQEGIDDNYQHKRKHLRTGAGHDDVAEGEQLDEGADGLQREAGTNRPQHELGAERKQPEYNADCDYHEDGEEEEHDASDLSSYSDGNINQSLNV